MTEPRYRVARDNAGYLQIEWHIDGKLRAVLPLEDDEAQALAKELLEALS